MKRDKRPYTESKRARQIADLKRRLSEVEKRMIESVVTYRGDPQLSHPRYEQE